MGMLTCSNCNVEFYVKKSREKTAKFCSAKCRKEYGWNKDRIDESLKDTYVCEWCNKEFVNWKTRQNRFCSAQCRSEYAASVSPGPPTKPESYITLICDICGKEYTVHKCMTQNGRHSRYCSVECVAEANAIRMAGKNNPNWVGGHSVNGVDYGPNWGRQRRKAIKRDGHRCQNCGYIGKDRILDIHHKIPFRVFNGDWQAANNIDNLVCLCRSCHIKIEMTLR